MKVWLFQIVSVSYPIVSMRVAAPTKMLAKAIFSGWTQFDPDNPPAEIQRVISAFFGEGNTDTGIMLVTHREAALV